MLHSLSQVWPAEWRPDPSNVVATIAAMGLLWILVEIIKFDSRDEEVANIRGPLASSWLYGSLVELLLSERYGEHEFRWQSQFGNVYCVAGCLGQKRLVISDHISLRYILNDPQLFARSTLVRRVSPDRDPIWPRPEGQKGRETFGLTLTLTHSDHAAGVFYIYIIDKDHRRIRNVFNNAFSLASIRRILPIFQECSHKLVQKVEELRSPAESTDSDANTRSTNEVDIYQLLQNATLDTVGAGGLGYDFNAIESPSHEIAQSHHNVLSIASGRSRAMLIADRLVAFLPDIVFKAALFIPSNESRILRNFKTLADKFSKILVRDKEAAFRMGQEKGCDVLSVVVDTNCRMDANAKLSESEVCHQVPALLVAGQDTAGNTLSWALYELSKHSHWQDKIRAELSDVWERTGGKLSYSELESLPNTNAFLKETIRLYPGVPLSERQATQDTVIPLSKPIVTTEGKSIEEIAVRKGQFIYIATAAYNRNEDIWGPDAYEFKPERWFDEGHIKDKVKSLGALGPYANLLSFLGGPYACIGLLELQVFFTDLVRHFEFSLPEESDVKPILATTLLPSGHKDTKLLLKINPIS
ncbi:hypothetical protein D9758_004663 [Tetrapyrgos nigripes]|uniref:Cytochrome P450 n=1 Tax=Tetrapyrgos nigripes TaxID=182062 RepID=A0A8H5H086_9AGAR|nr:hypothetical protein D9758_004663 [Tetrapyrgos nigripes]